MINLLPSFVALWG